MTLERSRVLRPCTIIPSHLYVERAADRQLSRILNDMGRPGYVLVARQMGKTNLLLHARSSMQGGEDAFVYLDVSNSFPNLGAFFQAVIDTCLETYPEKFAGAADKIYERRASGRQFLEHKQHELELRDLLRANTGRLIICFDEIDALTKTDYSDQVFSLVRSIYFSGRTNFDEFGRLTYVLSGVAEPTEIIKNRAISPFNIGEKIYLEDFSEPELREFIQNAQMSLSADVINRIYDWTGGNPRITWDVCAAVEALDEPVSLESVDSVVERLYLRSFDVPPVDHIRTLVGSDKEVRNAIMAIHYGKADSISDAVKGRLYLSGIISAPGPNSTVRIKNRVIEAALSEAWLEEVERTAPSGLEHADELYRDRRYADALVIYERCEEEGEVRDPDVFAIQKGSCQYFTGDYRGCIQSLLAHPVQKSRSFDLYVVSRSKIANAHLLLGEYQESIEAFENLIAEFGPKAEGQPLSFYEAKLNLSAAYVASGFGDAARVIELCESVIASSVQGGDSDHLERYKSIAYYHIFAALLQGGEITDAQRAMDRAIEGSARSDRAALMLERARKLMVGNERVEQAIACAEYCIASRVAITSTSAAERQLAFSVDRAASLILELALGGKVSAKMLDRFFLFCLEEDVGHEVSFHSVIMLAANYAFVMRKSDLAVRLYGEGGRIRSPEQADYWSLQSINLVVCPAAELLSYQDEFADHVVKAGAPPEGLQVRAVQRVVRSLMATGKHAKADEVLSASGVAGFDLSANSPGIEFFEYQFLRLSVNAALGHTEGLEVDARSLYEAIASFRGAESEIYPASYSKHLLTQVVALAPEVFRAKTVRRIEPKYGRNDTVKVRMADGSIEVGKFKRYEALIRGGRAFVIPA